MSKRRRLEYVKGTASKFWCCEVKGRVLHLRWGRIGTAGQSKEKEFSSSEAANKEMDKQLTSKLRKGYLEATGDKKAAATQVARKKTPVKKASAKKASAKKASAKKASAKKASAKKASAKKASAKKGVGRQTARKATTKKVSARKAVGKQTITKAAPKNSAAKKKTSNKKKSAAQKTGGLGKLLARAAELQRALSGRRPPADSAKVVDKSLAALEKDLGAELPTDVRQLYSTCLSPGESFPDSDLEWLSIRGIRSTLKMMHKVRPDFPADVIPIVGDGAGNYTCVAIESGGLVGFDHEELGVQAVGGTLQDLVEESIVVPLARALKDKQTSEALKGKGGLPSTAELDAGFVPTKIVRLKRGDVAKFDRESYAGGILWAFPLDESRLCMSFVQSCTFWDFIKQKELFDTYDAVPIAADRQVERLLGSKDGTLAIVDVRKLRVAKVWSDGVSYGRVASAISPCGTLVAHGPSGGYPKDLSGHIFLYDVKRLVKTSDPKRIADVVAHSSRVKHLAFLGDRSRLLSASWDDEVSCFDVSLKKPRRLWTFSPKKDVQSLATAPDGEHVALGLYGGGVVLLDSRGNRLPNLRKIPRSVGAVAFASSRLLLTASDSRLQVWDLSIKTEVASTALKSSDYLHDVFVRGRVVLTTHPCHLFEMI